MTISTSAKEMWARHQKYLGPAFVAFEAVMHVYLFLYLLIEKSAILVIGFTLFELSMFIYLLFEKKDKPLACDECPEVRSK